MACQPPLPAATASPPSPTHLQLEGGVAALLEALRLGPLRRLHQRLDHHVPAGGRERGREGVERVE